MKRSTFDTVVRRGTGRRMALAAWLAAAGLHVALAIPTLAAEPAAPTAGAPAAVAGSAGGGDAAEPWWRHPAGPAYQVLVYSYADSNGDGFGDLKGLASRLDNIQALGVTALWLSPIHPAASYHGYDVIDYRAVDPRLGSMEDFRALVAAAHARGIRILLDMVFNHSSAQHPWFKSFVAEPQGPYGDWYIRRDPAVEYGSAAMGGWASARRPDGSKAEYFATFWEGMPDLNLANPGVAAACAGILDFWLAEGVDGFRFDAAKEIFNTGKVAKGFPILTSSRAFWNGLRDHARAKKPDVLFVAEVYTTQAIEIAAYAQCFDCLFDFVTAKLLVELPAGGRDTGLVDKYLGALKLYRRVKDFVPAPFLSNHDQDRVASVDLARFGVSPTAGYASPDGAAADQAEGSRQALDRNRVQALLYLAMPGLPFIYYGEELGLTGRRYRNDDIARRDAFPWGSAAVAGQDMTTYWQKTGAMVESGQNSRTIGLGTQQGQPGSLWNLYRDLGKLRRAQPALQGDAVAACDWPGANSGSLVAYFRGQGGQRLLVIANLGSEPVRLALPKGQAWTHILDTGRAPLLADGELLLAPASAAVGAAPAP